MPGVWNVGRGPVTIYMQFRSLHHAYTCPYMRSLVLSFGRKQYQSFIFLLRSALSANTSAIVASTECGVHKARLIPWAPVTPICNWQGTSSLQVPGPGKTPTQLSSHLASYHVLAVLESTTRATFRGFRPLKGFSIFSTTSCCALSALSLGPSMITSSWTCTAQRFQQFSIA